MVTFVTGLLTAIEVLAALLLIGIILLQQSKAGGGLGAVGGGMTETVFGASAGNVLTKVTVVLAAVFLINTLLLAIIAGHRQAGRSVVESLPQQPGVTETAPAQGQPAETPAGAETVEGEAPAAPEAGEEATEAAEAPAPVE